MRIEQEFFDVYLEVHRPYINMANTVLSKYNLYSSQWLILKDIAKNGTTTLVDVSRRRQIEKPTANKVIKHLLELGLIRSEQGEDRRVKHLMMTDEGRALFEKVSAEMNEMQREIFKGFDAQEVEAMIDLLRRMNI